MDIQLLIQAKDKPEKSITIKKDVVIGRSQTCQFRVLSNDVSREHCRIVVGDDSVAVRDLGSSNGSIVNGKTIPPQTDFPLNPGDKLEVGPLTVVFDFKSSAVAKKQAAATPQPTQTPPATAVEPKKKTAAKPAAAPVAAAPAAAAPKKVKQPKPPVKPDESGIPVFAASADEDSNDGVTWSNFGDELSGELTFDVPEAEDVPETANQSELAESDINFQVELPPSVEPMPTPAATPVAKKTVAAPAPVPEPLTPAASDEGESSDEPIFADIDQPAESELDFNFDPSDAAESGPVESIPATPVAPSSPTAATPSSQPRKLKSLFGLFSKGKKPAAPPATAPTATVAPAPVSVETTAEETSAEPEPPFDLGVGGGDIESNMTDWLLGGSAAPAADEPVAKSPRPAAAVVPTGKPKSAKKPAAAPSTAPKKPAAAPAAAPEPAPAPESDTEQDFNDFFSQLGN